MEFSMDENKKTFDVLVIGELNVDLILNGDVSPEFSQKEQLLKDAQLVLGSSSAIFACGAARLGLKIAFLGLVGDDVFGKFVIDELNNRNVNTQAIKIDPKVKTGCTVILNRGNDRAILTHPGSISLLKKSDLVLSLFKAARHLHLGGYFLLENLKKDVRSIFRLAHQHHLSVSLDTNYDPSEKWDMGRNNPLRETDLFFPNETEIEQITKQPDLERALETLAYIPIIALKKGKAGAIARQNNETKTIQAMKVKVKDTVGAGDSFDAGFLYGFLSEFGLEKSLKLASVCGSLSTTESGGIAGQPTLPQAMRYLKNIK
jgi:sugar/nucleoside kinase (ribokinase family)